MNESIYAELIVDGIHVSPEMVELALKLKGIDRTILITDAMRAKGLSDGKIILSCGWRPRWCASGRRRCTAAGRPCRSDAGRCSR